MSTATPIAPTRPEKPVHPPAPVIWFEDLDNGDMSGAGGKNASRSLRTTFRDASHSAAHYPHPAIVRSSDFRTNEYAHLTGGDRFEPEEENPMLGFTNIIVMLPSCRTLEEADKVLGLMEENGLTQPFLGTDRGSHLLSPIFDGRDEAVKAVLRQLIEKAQPVGTSGQVPGNSPDFLEFLVGCGIGSISLNPDSVIPAIRAVAAAESTHPAR